GRLLQGYVRRVARIKPLWSLALRAGWHSERPGRRALHAPIYRHGAHSLSPATDGHVGPGHHSRPSNRRGLRGGAVARDTRQARRDFDYVRRTAVHGDNRYTFRDQVDALLAATRAYLLHHGRGSVDEGRGIYARSHG